MYVGTQWWKLQRNTVMTTENVIQMAVHIIDENNNKKKKRKKEKALNG